MRMQAFRGELSLKAKFGWSLAWEKESKALLTAPLGIATL
jgi:hypothetical protein